ncbi:hypothetical protein ACFE04_021377 [Oxalis oulophora]
MSKNKEQEEASSARNLENETQSNQGSQDLLRQLLLAINGLNANLQQMKTGEPPLVIENPDNIETPNSAFESQTHDAREETIYVPINQGPSVMSQPNYYPNNTNSMAPYHDQSTQGNFQPRTTMFNSRPRFQFHPQQGHQNWGTNQNGFQPQPYVNQTVQGPRGRTTQCTFQHEIGTPYLDGTMTQNHALITVVKKDMVWAIALLS